MMPEKARDNGCSVINETLDWVHCNSTPRLSISALVMQVMSVVVHPFANVRNPSGIPFVHESMDPVKMTVSPSWDKEYP